MTTMAKSLDNWIHNFTVTDCATHKKGYTVYKITSIVFPVYIPESLTCLSVWKRYNEVKRLQKSMVKRHRELQLNGSVPDIIEKSFFKRFDPSIIQERKEYILRLLDFIAQHPCLYKSHAFDQFFGGSHTPIISPIHGRPSNIESICDAIDVPFAQDYTLIDPCKDATEDDDITTTPSETNSSCSELIPTIGEDNRDDRESVDSITAIIEASSADYIYEAALEFSDAVRAEVAQDYRLAFERYKGGIAKLLNGSRYDVRKERQNIAKDKIQKYLTKAEQIHEQYIANGVDDVDGTIAGSQSSLATEATEQLIELPMNQLSKYKVIKVLHAVMQVQDVTDKKVFIMKAIEKPSSNNSPQTINLPQSIPHMVALISYFQSDTTIYLLLQQACGGRLWDYIRSRGRSTNQTTSLANLFFEPLEQKQMPCTDNSTPKAAEQSTKRDSGAFMDVLSRYRKASLDRSISNTGSLSDAIASLESNADIPAFDILSRDMDVLDLVSCSQKLIRSVSNTLQEIQQVESVNTVPSTDIITADVGLLEAAAGSFDSIFAANEHIRKHLDQNGHSPYKGKPIPRIPERSIRRWASEIVLALRHLHARDIICMDLRPDNILLGPKGQVLLTFFCRRDLKQLNNEAVDELYVAPERPLTTQSDWWSFGVILFEMLTGRQFIECHPGGISSYYEIQYPDDAEQMSDDAKTLLQELIQTNPELRLSELEICNHPFFNDIHWERVRLNGDCATKNGSISIYCD